MYSRVLARCARSSPLLLGVGLTLSEASNSSSSPSLARSEEPALPIVVVGGGAGGATLAWAVAHALPSQSVLLVHSGPRYGGETSSPFLGDWWTVFGAHTSAAEAVYRDGSPHPVTPVIPASGGASAHDTRITFIPTGPYAEVLCKKLGQSQSQLDVYVQATLNLMPLRHTLPGGEPFFDRVIKTAHTKGYSKFAPSPSFDAVVVPDGLAYVAVASFPPHPTFEGDGPVRWAPAMLLHDDVRPRNLRILSNTTVRRLVVSNPADGNTSSRKVEGVMVFDEKSGKQYIVKASEVALAAGALTTPALLSGAGVQLKATGRDHQEMAVEHAMLPAPKGEATPTGGCTSWPCIWIGGQHFLAHIGVSAPPYNTTFGLVLTPNLQTPSERFEVKLLGGDKNNNPLQELQVVWENPGKDFPALSAAYRRGVALMSDLENAGVVGPRTFPPLSDDVSDDATLRRLFSEHGGTAFHWACTTAVDAADPESAADGSFKVRGISGVRVASAAALPEIPPANPHFTITMLSLACADQIARDYLGDKYVEAKHLQTARDNLRESKGQFVRRAAGEEQPATMDLAFKMAKLWKDAVEKDIE